MYALTGWLIKSNPVFTPHLLKYMWLLKQYPPLRGWRFHPRARWIRQSYRAIFNLIRVRIEGIVFGTPPRGIICWNYNFDDGRMRLKGKVKRHRAGPCGCLGFAFLLRITLKISGWNWSIDTFHGLSIGCCIRRMGCPPTFLRFKIDLRWRRRNASRLLRERIA